jgi:hypothetical protein
MTTPAVLGILFRGQWKGMAFEDKGQVSDLVVLQPGADDLARALAPVAPVATAGAVDFPVR